MRALSLDMQGARSPPSRVVSAEKHCNNNKRSHDCLSHKAFVSARPTCIPSLHATMKRRNMPSRGGKSTTQGPRLSNDSRQFEHLDPMLHTCEVSLSERESSLNPCLSEFCKDLQNKDMAITCCADTRPAKKALIVHERPQMYLLECLQQPGNRLTAGTSELSLFVCRDTHSVCGAVHDGANNATLLGQDMEDPHVQLDVHSADSGVEDQTFIPLSCSLTSLSEEIPLAFQGDHRTCGQGQQGRQSPLKSAKSHPRVLVDVTNKFQIAATPDAKKPVEEDDIHRLHQRCKQVEFGKNTLGYERYLKLVPKSKRKQRDPRTPNPKQVCSKRSWDGQIRKWRRLLHNYDPPLEDGDELPEDFALLKSNQKDAGFQLNEEEGDSKIIPENPLSSSRPLLQKQATFSGLQEAKEDAGLSIYEDWVDC